MILASHSSTVFLEFWYHPIKSIKTFTIYSSPHIPIIFWNPYNAMMLLYFISNINNYGSEIAFKYEIVCRSFKIFPFSLHAVVDQLYQCPCKTTTKHWTNMGKYLMHFKRQQCGKLKKPLCIFENLCILNETNSHASIKKYVQSFTDVKQNGTFQISIQNQGIYCCLIVGSNRNKKLVSPSGDYSNEI